MSKNDGNLTSGGRRGKHVRVKTAKGRKKSSTQWLQRQLNDPFVRRAKEEGYRSRAAFKLTGIDDKFRLFDKSVEYVVDLGAAPGSWAQVAVRLSKNNAKVIGIDLQEMEPLEGAEFIVGDFEELEALEELESKMQGKADVIMSDMAARACGHVQTDHLRIMNLCELALDFAIDWLKPEGKFVAKVLRGGAEHDLLKKLHKHFKVVKHFKPAASRSDSAESFVVATGFKGKPESTPEDDA
jgi:23S rRNA (uridine2552-2'-O)-methyltransferase